MFEADRPSAASRIPRRIATISLHTSPLDQPGTGDAGGLNVYVVEVARQLARRGVEVEIFTRAVCPDAPAAVELTPGVLVRNVVAGPFEELDKNSLPAQICPLDVYKRQFCAQHPERERADLRGQRVLVEFLERPRHHVAD